MTKSQKMFGAAAAFGLAAMLAAGAAGAQPVRLTVGDLSVPGEAQAFDAQLAAAAHRACAGDYQPSELAGRAACESAARQRAVSQLTPAQREDYAQALRPAQALAMR
ncbi:MAG TPA: UrcA family protein [Caulobacteraceae bacterium]|jgi:UrcA family protein